MSHETDPVIAITTLGLEVAQRTAINDRCPASGAGGTSVAQRFEHKKSPASGNLAGLRNLVEPRGLEPLTS